MSNAAAIYNFPRKLERELEKLKANVVGKENSEVLLKFYKHLVAEGVSIARIIKYLTTLRNLASRLNKPFEKATKDDIIELVAKIEQRDYSEWTKHDYKLILKRFYKWLHNCDDKYPPEVRWIKVKHNIPSKLQKKDLLTVDEIRKIADCARHIRDKAFIWAYFESMRRLCEILGLKIGDVEFDDLGARLYVDGKVGKDYGRIILSVPILVSWLEVHPLKNDPNAPLWVTITSKKRCKQMSYTAVRTMIVDCAKRAGIEKRVWPYLIRHSRITPASKLLPHSLLCAAAGLKQGSKMPSVYIHLAGDDVDEAMCMLSGITNTEKREEQMKPVVCPRCNNKNLPGSKFCNKCGKVLDIQKAIELDQARAKLDELLNKLTEDPKKLEKFVTLIESV